MRGTGSSSSARNICAAAVGNQANFGKTGAATIVNPSVLPVQNLQELVALAARTPGGLNYASPSIGTTHHLATELLARHQIDGRELEEAVQAPILHQLGLAFVDAGVEARLAVLDQVGLDVFCFERSETLGHLLPEQW